MTEPLTSRDSCTGRWVVLTVLGVLGLVVMLIFAALFVLRVAITLYFATGYGLFSTFLIVPMVLLMLFAAFRWAQGRSVAPAGQSTDEGIFVSMTHHAVPAEHVAGLDDFRCPQCGFPFEITNVPPVEDQVVLCPSCRTRLYVG